MINVKKGIKMNKVKIKSPTGDKLICKGWHQEADCAAAATTGKS